MLTAVLIAASAAMINAELNFAEQPEVMRAGRTMALKTTVVQTSGDWLVIDGVDFAKFSPANEKGRLGPADGALSSSVVRHASSLSYAFRLATRGRYEVWEHVRFPGVGNYNHSESMDGGLARNISDSRDPVAPERYLPPHEWHWVRTTTYELLHPNCTHGWRFLPPGAWCGGAELDRIVLLRDGSTVKPEEVTTTNREIRRAKAAELTAKRIRLGRLAAWRLTPVLDPGEGEARFEYSVDGSAWRPVPVGTRVETRPGEKELLVRLCLVAAPTGRPQPIVYDYRFEVERRPLASSTEGKSAAEEGVAGVRPLRIVPNKIVYDEGEKGWFDIVLTNASESAVAKVVVEEKWGMGGEGRELWCGDVAFQKGERKELKVDYPGSAVRYGHEVRVTVASSSLSRSEFFNVNSDWWRVNQGCTLGVSQKKGEVTPQLKRMMDYYGYGAQDWQSPKHHWYESSHWAAHLPGMGPFLCYDNLQTRWQIHKSSIGGNAVVLDYPDNKVWGNLQNRAHQTGLIREDTRLTQARGLHHTHYAIPFAESGYGFEVARKNPEYFRRDRNGRFAGLFAHGRFKVNPLVTAKLDTLDQTPWIYCEPNLFREDVAQWALDDLLGAVSGFGEDGVYFDGRYMQHSGWDAFGTDLSPKPAADEAIVRNMRMTLKRIFEANPRAYIWSNGGRTDNPEMALADHPQSGLLKETQWPFLLNPQRPDHSYRGFMGGLVNVRDVVFKPSKYIRHPSKILHVGYLSTTYNAEDALKFRESWVMASHVMAIVASVCGHPFAGSLPMRPWKQMMTRYSELYWHEDNEIVERPDDVLAVDSLRDIWFRDAVYRRETAEYEQYAIHLMNAPEGEFCDETVIADPPAADDVEVELKVGDGVRTGAVQAWAIRPHGRTGAMEPTCEALAVSVADGRCSVAVPPFTYYTLLVIRRQK